MVIFSLPVPNNIVQSFLGAKDSSLGRFLLMIVTPCRKYSKNNLHLNCCHQEYKLNEVY